MGDLDEKNINDGKFNFFLVSWRAGARASGGTGTSIFLSLSFFLSGPGFVFMYVYFLRQSVEGNGGPWGTLAWAGHALLDA